MTETALAAAPGSPSFDRRKFLATLAAAGVMSAGDTVPAIAANHPDAVLLELAVAHELSELRRIDYAKLSDAAWDAFCPPKPPRALIWRPADFLVIIHDHRQLGRYKFDDGWHHVYETKEEIAPIRKMLARWKAVPVEDRFVNADHDIARAEELIAAHDEWERTQADAEAASGITDLNAAIEHEIDIARALLLQIASLAAVTLEGMAAKARAAALHWTNDPSSLAGVLQSQVADKEPCFEDLLGVSLMIDAMKLGGASTASIERSAA